MNLETLRTPPKLDAPPKKVVSLVPSITESLFALGFGETVVAVTKYCIHPAGQVKKLPKVGGTKKAKVKEIIKFEPDLVFANQEENDKDTIQALVEAGINVWLTFPNTTDEAVDDLRHILAIYQNDSAALSIVSLQQALDYTRAASVDIPKMRYFCPIWEGTHNDDVYWMTFNQHTYIHDLLGLMGGENIFAERERRFPLEADLGSADPEDPGERDTRYPSVTVDEVLDAKPDLILLPSEPFDFESQSGRKVQDLLVWTPAGKKNKIFFIDGSLITWPGVRMGKALQELPLFFIEN